MPPTYMNEDLDQSPGNLSNAYDMGKDIMNLGKKADTPAPSPGGDVKPAGGAGKGAGVPSGGHASAGTAAPSASSAGGAGMGQGSAVAGGGASAGAASSAAGTGAGAGSAAGPIGAVAGAVVHGAGGLSMKGTSAAQSVASGSGQMKGSGKTSGNGGGAGAVVAGGILLKMLLKGLMLFIKLLALIPLPILLIGLLAIGLASCGASSPSAIENELISGGSEVEVYAKYVTKTEEFLEKELLALETRLNEEEKGKYKKFDLSSDNAKKSIKQVGVAKLLAHYSLYKGSGAALDDYLKDLEKLSGNLFTPDISEKTYKEEVGETYIDDYEMVPLTIKAPVTYDDKGNPIAPEKEYLDVYYYRALGTSHKAVDGEMYYPGYEAVAVTVAIKDEKGTIIGHEDRTYFTPNSYLTTIKLEYKEVKEATVDIPALDEEKILALWPIDMTARNVLYNTSNKEALKEIENEFISFMRDEAKADPKMAEVLRSLSSSLGSANIDYTRIVTAASPEVFKAMWPEIKAYLDAQALHGVRYDYGTGATNHYEASCSSFVSHVLWSSGYLRSDLWPSGYYATRDCRALLGESRVAGVANGMMQSPNCEVFIDQAQLEAGDIMFLTGTQEMYPGLATHIMIYVGDGSFVDIGGDDGVGIRKMSDHPNLQYHAFVRIKGK